MKYEWGSEIAVPGVEAVLEYGDLSDLDSRSRIKGAYQINDRSKLEQVKIDAISGLHGDPDARDARDARASDDGEDAGKMLYGGRTIGLTGKVKAGNIPAVRDHVTRFFSQFGKTERDLLIHPPSELPIWVNHVPNPELTVDARGWEVASGTGVTINGRQSLSSQIYTGRILINDGVSSGSVARVMTFDELNSSYFIADWSGEDVCVGMHVGVGSGSDVPDSIRLTVYDDTGTEVNAVVYSNPSPSTYRWLQATVPASSISRLATKLALSLVVDGPDGDYDVRMTRAMLVLVEPGQAPPIGYVGPGMPGCESLGLPGESKSVGRLRSVSIVDDPLFETVDPSTPTRLATWTSYSAPPSTVNAGPAPSLLPVEGARSSRSCYYKITKDDSSTSRILAFASQSGYQHDTPSGVGIYGAASVGRTYRGSARVQVLQAPTDEPVRLNLLWHVAGFAGVGNTITAGPALPIGVTDTEIVAVAPNGAMGVSLLVGALDVTENLAVVEVAISDPCLVDVTDYDPGKFFGLGDVAEEIVVRDKILLHSAVFADDVVVGTVRRIPRPFLIRRVRKTSEARSPEQQTDQSYRRDFTMSLRASDPRIYSLDERIKTLKMAGTTKLVVDRMFASFTTDVADLPVPTGYTYEGGYRTHPGHGPTYRWSWSAVYRQAIGGTYVPRQRSEVGIGVRAYDFNTYSLTWADGGGDNTPAQDINTRMYRSAEGFTYGEPKVILGGAPSGDADISSTSFAYNYSGSNGSKTFKYNTLGVLLKRVFPGTWLELRWNSYSKAAGDQSNPSGSEPNSPYAFELWCSHNASGSSATTKLASWDYESYDSSSAHYSFSPIEEPRWLVAWLLDDVVHWEMWRTYPSPVDFTGLVESGSFALPSGLISVVGSAVAGSTGWFGRIGTGTDAEWQDLAASPPFTQYFESSDAAMSPNVVAIPMIGSIDSPPVLELRGGLVDPIVSITVPAFDGEPQETSVARFTGTIEDASPVYVDLARRTIKDQFGANMRKLVVPGSSFAKLRPGTNYVTLQARDWDDYPTHLIVKWRDALI